VCGAERTVKLDDGSVVAYELVEPGNLSSARETALALLRQLAEGNIEAVAGHSNAPDRRREVLVQYQNSVGEAEFRRIFSRYLESGSIVAEAAIGERRLIVWDLGDAGHRIAGQYFVRTAGRFVIDDVPNDERRRLARVLASYRAGKLRPSDGTD